MLLLVTGLTEQEPLSLFLKLQKCASCYFTVILLC